MIFNLLLNYSNGFCERIDNVLTLQPFIRVIPIADLTSDSQLRRHPQLNAKPVYSVHVWSRRVDGLLTTTARSRKCATRGQRFTSPSGRNCSPVWPEVRERTVRRSSLSLSLFSQFDFYVQWNYEFWLENSSHLALLIPLICSLLRAENADANITWCRKIPWKRLKSKNIYVYLGYF